MIDVVHTKQGKSFTGLVAYLLEGEKGRENPDRVDWTETRNIATGNPRTAARVMAAIALDQDRLKAEAGVKNTGRKSKNHVLHYTLSWPAGQEVPREEMMRAVDGSLASLGEKAGQKGGKGKKKGRTAVRDQFASEHQVLVVAHNDSPNKVPHCHVVVNRVHPEHGVMLPTSNDFKMLSRWAERYERETGGIIVDRRALNNAARDRGESVPGQKREPRDQFKLHGNDNRPAAQKVRQEQRAKDAKLARESADQRKARKQEWRDLSEAHRGRTAALREAAPDRIRSAIRQARDHFSGDWATLYHEHRAAEAAFDRREEHLAGKAMNALKALLSLSAPVNVLWSRGARRSVLEAAQASQERELAARQRAASDQAAREAKDRLQQERAALTGRFLRERAELILRHRTAAVQLREKWEDRKLEREQAWDKHRQAMAALPPDKRFGAQSIEPDDRMKRALEVLERARDTSKKQDADRGRQDDRDR